MSKLKVDVQRYQKPKAKLTFWGVVNVILALLSCVILISAALLPVGITAPPNFGTKETIWTIAAVVALVLSFMIVTKYLRFAWLIFMLSCVFWFSSCASNFHWAGG